MHKSLQNPPYKKKLKFKPDSSLNKDHLAQLGFDHSSVANIIISVSSGKIILVNTAASKLLGYSQKALLTKSKMDIFDITLSNFKKKLKRYTESGKPSIILVGIKKGGQLFPCEMTYAVFEDAHGISNAVVSIADKSQSILDQLNIDIKKEKIVSDNIILAKKNQKNIDSINQKKVAENIGIAKSKQRTIDTRMRKLVDHNIVLAQIKSDEEKLTYENVGRKKVLDAVKENFRILFNSSSDVLFDSDLLADKVMINDAYEKEFGYKKTEEVTAAGDWATHIHPDDKKEVMKDYHRMLQSKEIEWKIGYRFLRADGSVANVLSSRIILRGPDNKPYRMIGCMHDISKQKVLEDRLEKEIKLKEKQIAEAAEDAKDTERADIGKELHDNVNQLLGASRLYLEMAKRGGADSELYLSRSSEYTLTAINEIRKLSKGLTTDIIKNSGLCLAIEKILTATMEVSPERFEFKEKGFDENSVNDKFKLNIYRIIQEQLNNILKHARATKVVINLVQSKSSVKLIISDNGIGFDTSKKRSGIGVANVKSRAASYNGNAEFISRPGSGCVLNATFPFSAKIMRRAL